MPNDEELRITSRPGSAGEPPFDEELIDESAIPPGEEEGVEETGE